MLHLVDEAKPMNCGIALPLMRFQCVYICAFTVIVCCGLRFPIFAKGSAIGPVSFVVCASDLSTVTPGNKIHKYADDTYIMIPACNIVSKEKRNLIM